MQLRREGGRGNASTGMCQALEDTLMNRYRYALASLLTVAFTCSAISSAAYASESVSIGTVLAIEASANPDAGFARSNAGAALGAAIGGAAGYKASSGSNAYLAASAGTALGAFMGNRIDTARSNRATYSIVVQLDGGPIVAVTDPRPAVNVGSRVYLIGGNRVIPARTNGGTYAMGGGR